MKQLCYSIIRTPDEIKSYLCDASVVAFDFETAPLDNYRDDPSASLDPHKSAIVGISISVEPGTARYIPLNHKVGENADAESVMNCLTKNLFQNNEIVKVVHNLVFESMFLFKHGIVLQEPVYDTMSAAQLTLKNETEFRSLRDSGLKTLVPELFGVALPSFEETVGGRYFDEFDPGDEKICQYACSDADYALRLYHKFSSWFQKNIPMHHPLNMYIESPAAVFTGLMRYNGLAVDCDLLNKKCKETDQKLSELRERIREVTGDIEIGTNCSTRKFKDFLYITLALPVLKRTEKGTAAVDDEALQLLSEYCVSNRPDLLPFLESVQEYRKLSKIKTTYLDGYKRWINSSTGRIHPELMSMGTETGRFAARNPNVQNMPRKSNDPVGVRQLIVSSEGSTFIDFDLSQIELRVGASYSCDPNMQNVYRLGGDIHAQTTSVIFGIPLSEAMDKDNPMYKERRSIAKSVNFGAFYGLYPRGLRKMLKFQAGIDLPMRKCEEILANFKNGYPRLALWQIVTIDQARNDFYVETAFGRRRYLRNIRSTDWALRTFDERCALNTPIQGTAAEFLKLSMCRLLPELKDKPWLRPVLQIHDELLFEVDSGHEEEAIRIIREAMERQPFDEFDVPIVAEGSIGKSFGSLHELEDKNNG